MLVGAASLACVPAMAAAPAQGLPVIDVFKSPTCGCCSGWVAHLEREGFTVKVHEVEDTGATRTRLHIPDALASCHTASVAGYALEGHVPAREIKKLLAAKPAAVGLAVPGMPMGSPGMEMGHHRQAYEVMLVLPQGATSVYASYPAAGAMQ